MLEVALSIVFILLVLSLFATTLMEIIASIFSLRGKHLSRGLKRMLGSNGDLSEFDAFIDNPLFKQLRSRFLVFDRPPSYMSSKMFSTVLWNTLFKEEVYEGQREEELKEKVMAKINGIKDENLRTVMQQFIKDANFQLPDLRAKLEDWYDEIMERVGGWYKRNTQAILIFVGLFIAVAFDADTINIFHELSNNPATRTEIVQLVDSYSQNINAADANTMLTSQFKDDIDLIIQQELDALKQSSQEKLGLGWYPETTPSDFWSWFYKVLGWIVTALAVSLGAPFWFGLLKKIMNLRSSGGVPQQIVVATTSGGGSTSTTTVPQTAIKEPIDRPEDPVG